MNIAIKATNMQLTEAIEAYVHKRFDRLEKLVDGDDDTTKTQVEVGKTTRHHKKGDFFRAEINLNAFGKQFYAQSEKEDLYAAIDDVKEEIEREIISVKNKVVAKRKRDGGKVKNILKHLD